MTPDELFTRVHRQRAEMIASELAMDALMMALPPEVQQKWLKALQSLQATRDAVLSSQGSGPVALAQSNAAIDRRLLRLTQAQKGQ